MKINFRKMRGIAMLAIIVFQTIVTAVPVHAITTADVRYDTNYSRNMNVTFNGENRDVTISPIYLNRGSGEELVFCVDPFTLVLQGPGYSSNPFTLNRKANLVSSLWRQAGTDWDTYFVAQEMMYEETGSEVHSNGNLSPVQRQTIKNRINQVIADYEKKPSFHLGTFKGNLGESIVLEDTNGVDLSQFDVLDENSAKVDYSIQGNKLTITPRADSNESGVLILKKSLAEGTPFIWRKLNSQDLASAGIVDPNELMVRLEIEKTGEVKITKLDEGTGEVVPNTEFDVSFDGKTQEVKTDGNGEAVVKGIFHDTKVTVTETFVPAPYILDENNTKEVIIRAGKTSSVEFRNERATGKTTLTKRDKTTESDKPLNPNYSMIGAKYGLFKEDGTMIKEFELDETLTATIDQLELGIYYWKETVAPVGYTLDPTEHIVELTYKDQYTPVVIDDARSDNDVIRMNLDGQKVIQNDTNEMFKNGVEFTMTNQRTGEEFVVTSANVDGKAGYFKFADLPLDDYVLTETKGVDGYRLVDPLEIKHSYNKETESFTFTITDQKTGNLLHEETLTQLELSEGINVDLGTYLLKNKAIVDEKPIVTISTEAHTGNGIDQTFIWGEDVQLYDDVRIIHKNIPDGTERAFETILVAIYPDGTQKDVWTSGKNDYTVTDGEMVERVLAEYDYRQDPEGTRYFFKELGYSKTPEGEYEEDAEHNLDGNERTQDIIPTVPELPKEEVSPAEKGSLPYTGEQMMKGATIVGLLLLLGVAGGMYLKRKKESGSLDHADYGTEDSNGNKESAKKK